MQLYISMCVYVIASMQFACQPLGAGVSRPGSRDNEMSCLSEHPGGRYICARSKANCSQAMAVFIAAQLS